MTHPDAGACPQISLSDDFPKGTGVHLWTLGHAHHPLAHFLELLRSQAIELVVDVRSRPASKWAEHFNREALEQTLVRVGFDYAWRGDSLGGIPSEARFYDGQGHTLYEPLSQEASFMKGIAWLEFEAERRRLALVCLEEEPERCHRHVLLGRVLTERGADIRHIRRTGSIETYHEVGLRLGRAQSSLFDPADDEDWRSPAPMRRPS